MSQENRILVDARGGSCSSPIIMIVQAYQNAHNGDILEIWTNPGFESVVEAVFQNTGGQILELRREQDIVIAVVKVKKT
ncbi:MAG: sulfurtransferase TusA family protein [Vulcanisaeta sp. AZ3]